MNSLHARKYTKSQDEKSAPYLVFESKKRSEVAQGVGIQTDMIVLSRQPTKIYTDDELKKLNTVYEELLVEERELMNVKINAIEEGDE